MRYDKKYGIPRHLFDLILATAQKNSDLAYEGGEYLPSLMAEAVAWELDRDDLLDGGPLDMICVDLCEELKGD